MSVLESFTVWDLGVWLMAASAVVVVAVAAVRLSTRTGLPSLLIYLLIGVAIGEEGLGFQFSSLNLTQVLGYLALALILAEGGLTTSWGSIRPSVAPAALLATVGVTVSIGVVAVAAHLLLGQPWPVALIIGAILASTDAAAVFSVLRSVPLPHRLTGILEAESGFNDAPVVLVVVLLSAHVAEASGTAYSAKDIGALVGMILLELVGGALMGLFVGWVGGRAMRLLVSGHAGLFPIGVMAWVMLAYGAASAVHTSGFLSTYLAALVLGNMSLPHRAGVRGFAQAMGWMAQIGLFVMLGLLVTPSQLLPELLPAIILGLVLLLVARPASVVASCGWFNYSWRDQLFLSWAGLRGAVPIVLATVPLIEGVRDVGWLLNLVFVLVVVFTLVQAPSLPWVANHLGVTQSERAMALEVEAVPLEEMGADLLEVRIGDSSRLHGIEVFELRLPPGAHVALIVRDKQALVPVPTTPLRRADQLLIVATPATRRAVERQLHDIDRAGRLAGWGPARGKTSRPRRPAPPSGHGRHG